MTLIERIDGEIQRDGLTGLPWLEVARQRLTQWQARDGVSAPPRVQALMLGFRRFETINLAYGEPAGDGALVEVARRISQFAGSELDGPWLAARGSGGTFVVIASEACSRERWQLFAEQLAERVARPIERRAGMLRLSPRIALLRVVDGETAESVLDRLAQSLAAARHSSGRRVMWAAGEASRGGRTAVELESDLLKALDGGQIEVVFQPQFALDGADAMRDTLCGAEALARWNHPTLGRVGAAALFEVAERADHVAALSRHIAQAALVAAAAWPSPLRLSLNVTADDLAAGSYAQSLGQAIEMSGFPRERLTLEVTEQVLLADMQLAERTLGELAATGIRIALDDFGAGFCNFHYLKTLPLHYLKLDRAMVDGIEDDPRDLAILRAIVAMSRALDLTVIAEGIESEGQRQVIRAEHCSIWQGFLRAQPMEAGAFLDLARVMRA